MGQNPSQIPMFDIVIIDGRVELEGSKHTGELAGRVLRFN